MDRVREKTVGADGFQRHLQPRFRSLAVIQFRQSDQLRNNASMKDGMYGISSYVMRSETAC